MGPSGADRERRIKNMLAEEKGKSSPRPSPTTHIRASNYAQMSGRKSSLGTSVNEHVNDIML